MAVNGIDIQIENGNFSRIHNAILERLAVTEFTGRELRCLLYLLRMTYGFQRKEYALSLTDWSAGTNISRPNIPETLRRLADRNIIYRTENGKRKPATFGFNKYFEQWDVATPTGKGFDGIHVDNVASGIDVDTKGGIPVDTMSGIDVDTKGGIPLQTATTCIKDIYKETSKENMHTHTNGNGAKPADKPKRERSDKQKALDAWVDALAYALEFDPKIPGAYSRWAKTGEGYGKAGYTPDDVRVWKDHLWPANWRCERGQKPTKGAMDEGLPDVKRRREVASKPKPTAVTYRKNEYGQMIAVLEMSE